MKKSLFIVLVLTMCIVQLSLAQGKKLSKKAEADVKKASLLVQTSNELFDKGDFELCLVNRLEATLLWIKVFGIDNEDSAELIYSVAKCYAQLSDYENAVECAKTALNIRENVLGKCNALNSVYRLGLANYYSKLGDKDSRILILRDDVECDKENLAAANSDTLRQVIKEKICSTLGYLVLNESESITYFKDAVSHLEEAGRYGTVDGRTAFLVTYRVAEQYEKKADLEHAEAMLDKAVVLTQKNSDSLCVSTTYRTLAQKYKSSSYNDCVRCYTKCCNLLEGSERQPEALKELGVIHEREAQKEELNGERDPNKLIECYERARECYNKANNKAEEYNVNAQIASIMAKSGKRKDAVSLLSNTILACGNDTTMAQAKVKCLQKRGEIEKENENYEAALADLEEAYKLHVELKNYFYAFSTAQYLCSLYSYSIPNKNKVDWWREQQGIIIYDIEKETKRLYELGDYKSIYKSYSLAELLNIIYSGDFFFMDKEKVIYWQEHINKCKKNNNYIGGFEIDKSESWDQFINMHGQAVFLNYKDQHYKAVLTLDTLIQKVEQGEMLLSSAEIGEIYDTRSLCYAYMGVWDSAEYDCKRAIKYYDLAKEQGKTELCGAYFMLSGICEKTNRLEEAYWAATKRLESAQEYWGQSHSETIGAYDFRGSISTRLHDKNKAFNDRKECFEIVRDNIKKNYVYLTQMERVSYTSEFLPLTKHMFKTAQQFNETQSEFTDMLFEQQLLEKGLLITTEAALQRVIDNDSLLSKSYQLIRNHRRAAFEEKKSPIEIAEHLMMADKLERELGKKADSLNKYLSFIDIKTDDVKNRLKGTDIAIEFVNYEYGDDTIMYAALIMSPKWEHVKFVPLYESSQLTISDDVWEMMKQETTDLLWKPVLEGIKELNVRNIYFAPTGDLYKLPIEYMPLGESDSLTIADCFERVCRLSSTRELCLDNGKNNIVRAAVYGGMRYDSEFALCFVELLRSLEHVFCQRQKFRCV